MWKLRENAEGNTKLENARNQKMKFLLKGLKGTLKEIDEIEVGLNFNKTEASFDVVLHSTFKDRGSLEVYQNHPEHKRIGDFIGRVRNSRAVVDYKV